MSSPDENAPAEDEEEGELIADTSDEARELRAFAEKVAQLKKDEAIPNDVVQQGLTALVRLYSVKFQLGERWSPFTPSRPMPATAVMIMSTAMLRAAKVEVFELGMWQSWSGA